MTTTFTFRPIYTSTILPVIHTTDGSTMTVKRASSISIPHLFVLNVFHVPKLYLSLLYVGQLTELGSDLYFSSNGCVMQDSQTGKIVRTNHKVGCLFKLTSLHIPSSTISLSTVSALASSSIKLWHFRLGHASLSHVKNLMSRGLLGSISFTPFDCMSCQLSKQPTLPINNSESIGSAHFALIHSDVCRPSPITTIGVTIFCYFCG